MRNPIYCGWRVYDKRRDPSASARRTKTDGRQADRPKIPRAAHEVIRLRVIDPPLVSESDFARVQEIIKLKKQRHWRCEPNNGESHHRWTYNGFLTCSECGNLVYTSFRRRDYYVCSAKRTRAQGCPTQYMRRETLEQKLDHLFAMQPTQTAFLRSLANSWQSAAKVNERRDRRSRMQSELEALREKRERVLDSYFEGVICREERDRRLASIQRDQEFYQNLLLRAVPAPTLSADTLASLFSPFVEWKLLGRGDKRRLLAGVVPEIHVANYKIAGLPLLTGLTRRNEVNHTGAAYFVAAEPKLYVPLELC